MSVQRQKHPGGRPRELDLAVEALEKGIEILEATLATGEAARRLALALSHLDDAMIHAHRAADARKKYGVARP